MTEEITTVKYLIDQLVDTRVACQFWIDKDHDTQDRINELEKINDELSCPERMKALEIRNKDLKNAAQTYQKELVKAEKRIKELEEFDQNLNKAGSYRFTKGLEDTIVHLKARIKELEERVGRIDELTNEVYGEGPDIPDRFLLDGVTYYENEQGCFVDEDKFTIEISFETYIEAVNKFLKEQEDPRDYPEDPSYE